MNEPAKIDKVLYFPSSPFPITESAFKQAKLFGGDKPKKAIRGYPLNPIMWEIPTKNTGCDAHGCGYYGWGFEASFFPVGDPCPGKNWRYDLEQKENDGEKMTYKDLRSYIDQTRETEEKHKRPTCVRNGKMQRLWTSADAFNMTYISIIDETRRGNDWFVKGRADDDKIGQLLWKKWFSLAGAIKRIPKQLKGHVNVDNISREWKTTPQRSSPF